MRRSKSLERSSKSENSRKSSQRSTSSPCNLHIELENLALKAKNADLVKAHVKISQQNHELTQEIQNLQSQLFAVESKYNNVISGFEKLEQELSKCTPSILDIVYLLLKTSRNIHGESTSNNNTPKVKNATVLSVKPHTVNGTVLNLNPTITLNRMPSNTTQVNGNISNNETITNNDSLNNATINNEEFGIRTSTPGNSSNNSAEAVEEEPDSLQESEQILNNLSVIQEESLTSVDISKINISEVKIRLKPLSARELTSAFPDSTSSTEVNINNTCFNIEATFVEDDGRGANKKLSADISFASPNENSTPINSNDSERTAAPTPPVFYLPTPSMRDIGDITPSISKNASKLAILNETKWSVSPSKKAQKQDEENDSPKSSRGGEGGLVNLRRGRSESDKTSMNPRIIIERVDVRQLEDDVKENKKTKQSVKNERKSSKKAVRPKRELQIKLSNFVMGSSPRSSSTESLRSEEGDGNGRPKRAARPTNLKDASLRTKLRRMI